MCAVSMVMDHYRDKWDWQRTNPNPMYPYIVPLVQPPPVAPPVITQEEVDEFRRLLERAREYDRRMNQPDCELEEKKQALLQVAKTLGVEIDFL